MPVARRPTAHTMPTRANGTKKLVFKGPASHADFLSVAEGSDDDDDDDEKNGSASSEEKHSSNIISSSRRVQWTGGRVVLLAIVGLAVYKLTTAQGAGYKIYIQNPGEW